MDTNRMVSMGRMLLYFQQQVAKERPEYSSVEIMEAASNRITALAAYLDSVERLGLKP